MIVLRKPAVVRLGLQSRRPLKLTNLVLASVPAFVRVHMQIMIGRLIPSFPNEFTPILCWTSRAAAPVESARRAIRHRARFYWRHAPYRSTCSDAVEP